MLWGCSMVCIGKNIANCSKKPQFLPVMCALCTPPPPSKRWGKGTVTFHFPNFLRRLDIEVLLCACWLDKVLLLVHCCAFLAWMALHCTLYHAEHFPPPPLHVTWQTSVQPVHTLKCLWNHRINGTAEHCCICIPGRACVERFVDLLAAFANRLTEPTTKALCQPPPPFAW